MKIFKCIIPTIIYICFFIYGFFATTKVVEAMIRENNATANIWNISTPKDFEEFMKTKDYTKAICIGTIEAIEPITSSLFEGEFMEISTIPRRYEKNEYGEYEWFPKYSDEQTQRSLVSFLGQTFELKHFDLPPSEIIYTETISKRNKIDYYVRPSKYENIKLYVERKNGEISYTEGITNFKQEMEERNSYFDINFFKIAFIIIYYSFITAIFIGKLYLIFTSGGKTKRKKSIKIVL